MKKFDFNLPLRRELEKLISSFSCDEEKFRNLKNQNILRNLLLGNEYFQHFMLEINKSIEKNGFAIISSFDFQDNIYFIALGSYFGTISEPYNSNSSKLIQDLFYDPVINSQVESFHTDDTGWEIANDYTMLWCIQSDNNGGGISRIINLQNFLLSLKSNHPSLYTKLFSTKHPFKQAAKNKVVYDNILEFDSNQNVYLIKFLRQTIEDGYSEINEEIHPDIYNLSMILEDYEDYYEHSLSSSDILVFNNRKTLHMRTSISDKNSNRHLKRIKIYKNND